LATPGDTDTDAGRRGELLLNKCCTWNDTFYNKPIDELRELSQKGDRNGVFYMEYSYSQIGLTNEWFRNISQKIGNMITVRREILLQRLRGSSNSPYDRDDLDKIIDLAKKPIRSVMLNKYYQMDIYEEFNKNIPYIVGVDCSNGSNKDSNAFTVINPYSTAVVAEFECSYVGDVDWMACLTELVTDYIPRAIMCIERNHVGQFLIQMLLRRPQIAGRIYFDKHKELADENMDEIGNTESILRRKAREKTYYGVWTGPKSRDAMFAILADRIKTHKEEFVGQNVTRDITKLVQKGTKILAQEPWHDDSIMSYLIGMYVYYYGNNLDSFGFSKADVVALDADNQGLYQPDEVNTIDLPDSVAGFVSAESDRKSQTSYEDMYRETLLREQEKERILHEKGLVHSDVYENAMSSDTSAYFDDYSDGDFSLIDELNGVNSSSGYNPGGNDDIFGVF